MKSLRIITVILIIFLPAGLIHAQNLQELKVKSAYSEFNDTNTVQLKEKSPLLAGTLSFVVPGLALGQIYNKQYSKFLVHTIISSACILTAVLFIDRGTTPLTYGSGTQTCYTLSTISIAAMYVYAGNWIWSVVDAVISANSINKQIKLQKYRSDVINKLKFGLILDKNKNVNLKFAFEL